MTTGETMLSSLKSHVSKKTLVGAVALLLVLGNAHEIVSTVPAGSYQIKQAAWTGTLTAKMDPGVWFRNFGEIFTFPKSETFFFTADHGEGQTLDQSIEVTFADGSICHISGTARIIMPPTGPEAIHILKDLGFRSYEELEHKLILPTIRRALVLTANMMTAQESYNVKRPDFLKWASDQIENGIAATDEVEKEVKDPVTNELSVKKFKVIRLDKNGRTVYEHNPLAGTGIVLQNFEVKKFKYSEKVEAQIASQQESLMGVATAKAEAAKAEQEKVTAEAKGQSAVMTAKYEKEKEKIRAVVDAESAKAVAITAAQQEKETAQLKRDAAEFTKQKEILLGQGEAERKRLVMEADGALEKKLDAYKYGVDALSKAWAARSVPTYYVENGGDHGSGSGEGKTSMDSQNMQFMNMVNTMLAKNIGIDLSVQSKAAKK